LATFIDYAKIYIRAGKGGPGCVSFRREKYVPNGGPDGGDGGSGASVFFEARSNITTLLDLKYKKTYIAPNGMPGEGRKKHGRNGKKIVIAVPCGTVIYNAETKEKIADLVEHKQRYLVCKGGKGGFGNVHFATAVRQAPKYAQKGLPGEDMEINVELKLLADIGLLGYPNVGKSSLLSQISASKPKIANYPFTTLIPNLGVVSYKGQKNFVVADVPGLIEGAHTGHGLGHQFLRHIERTKLLVHVLDVATYEEERDPIKDFEVINDELKNYEINLCGLKQIIALNKIDLIENKDDLDEIVSYFKNKGYIVKLISAVTTEGVQSLVGDMAEQLQKIQTEIIEEFDKDELNEGG